MAHGLDAINWQAPWLAHLREVGEPAAKHIDTHTNVCDVLNRLQHPVTQAKASVQFIPQTNMPTGMPYESCIFQQRQCPTRNNLHDFFNGLCWLHFPKTKERLNQLHARQIDLNGSVTVRGKVRDALTLFDENAAILIAPEPIWKALLAKDWQRLFIQLRPIWQEAKLVLFGHALMEKLVTPRKPITAHIYVSNTTNFIANYPYITTYDGTFLSYLDNTIAASMSADQFAVKPFTPLPVLGVPGWCEENENPNFYTDSTVFRMPTSSSA